MLASAPAEREIEQRILKLLGDAEDRPSEIITITGRNYRLKDKGAHADQPKEPTTDEQAKDAKMIAWVVFDRADPLGLRRPGSDELA